MPKKLRSGYSRVFLFTLLALLEFPLSTGAQSLPNASSLDAQVLENGNVVISENNREVARIFPEIFTGPWVDRSGWPNHFTFEKRGQNDGALVNGVGVDLKAQVTRIASGLHIHYTLVPRESLEVSNIQARLSLPYEDWDGSPYQLNQTTGQVAANLQAESDSVSLSVGPTRNFEALSFQLNAQTLHLVLFDERYWSPQLTAALTHNEPTRQAWTWGAGEAKEFDFTVTFNQSLSLASDKTAPSSTAPAPGTFPLVNGCPATVIDDFEDPGRNAPPPIPSTLAARLWISADTRMNFWGGHWRTQHTEEGSIGVSYNGPGHDSNYSAGVTGITPGPPGWVILQSPLYTSWEIPFNAAGHGLAGIQFWMKGDGRRYWIEVPNRAVTDLNWYGVSIEPPGDWTFYQIPFAQMRQQTVAWATQIGLPEHPDGSDVIGFQILNQDAGPFAYSLDQIAFYGNYVSPCATPAPETNIQPVPVPTATPLGNGCPPLEIDDFEKPALNNASADRVNLLGGNWTTVASPNCGIGVLYGGPGAEGSNFSANLAGNVAGDTEADYAAFQTTLSANGVPFNAVDHGRGGVQFWMKGDGQPYWFNLLSRSVTDTTGYSCYLRPAQAGVWTFFQIPFKEMVRQSWWEHRAGSGAADGTNITGVGFMAKSKGPFAFSVDQVGFYCSNQTPTPTWTPTNTFTPQIPPTPVPTWPPRPIPTFTPWTVPTATPFLLIKNPKPKPFFTAIPSPTPFEYPRPAPIKLYPTRVPKSLAVSPPTPGPTPIHLPPLDTNVAVVFYAPPANINVTFADGPGRYQMEVVDSVGNSLESIFDQTVSYTSSTWIEWDGLNEKGKAVPPGQYYAVLYKDGKALRSISIIRIPPNP